MSVAELIPRIEPYMRVDEVKSGVRFVILEGELHPPHSSSIEAIQFIFKGTRYTAFFERNRKSKTAPHRLKIGTFMLRQVKQRFWLNWLLFGLAVITTTIAGALWAGADILSNPLEVWRGLPFSLSLILILGSHELGHYLACRYYHMQATPPYFIPFIPFFAGIAPGGGLGIMPSFGTMGAVIRMGITPNRQALIRVGAVGPLVGFIVAIPVTIVGLILSEVVPQDSFAGGLQFGESLIFQILAALVKGPLSRDSTILIHPIALAGWLGFLVTALNLLPLSQLDGGHIAYAVLGEKRIYLVIPVYVLILAAAFLFKAWVWLIWGVITLIFGFRHPPAADEITPLTTLDIIIAIAALIILILTVMPVPIKVVPLPATL